MEATAWFLGFALGLALFVSIGPSPSSELFDVDLHSLAARWEKEHISPADPYDLKHSELKRRLHALAREFSNGFLLQQCGTSLEGREIYLVSMGTGNAKILLWSQMHGDEPTATSGLLDLIHFIGKHRAEPWIASILQKYTLLCLPMLNPDGAERNQRRNAQHLDINRDARMLQTPEGKLLKEIRDRHRPFLGFNLHDQNSLTTVGDTGKVATIALLAVALNHQAPAIQAPPPESSPEDIPTSPAVPITKQVSAVLYEALAPFVYGHISRYDETYNPRAFGDNFALWGTPVVLIESGGIPAGQPANLGVKLNFIGLLAALNSLATGRIANANPAVYDSLKINSDVPIFDLILHNAWIFTGTGVPLFRGDIALRHEVRMGGKDESIIVDIGDLGIFSAHRTIDCTGALVTPGLIVYDPKASPFKSEAGDDKYLHAGVITLLEAASWEQLAQKNPDIERWKRKQRPLNWAFVVAGDPSTSDPDSAMKLSEWLAAGGRAWVRPQVSQTEQSVRLGRIPGWFGIEALSTDEAAKYAIPDTTVLRGNPEKILPRLTSEAARRFQLGRRGVIRIGAIADLVIWRAPAPQEPVLLGNYTPSQIILNGHAVDLGQPEIPPFGRFLPR